MENPYSQIKESYKEAGALRRKFDDDVSLIRRDAENCLAKQHRLAKKQQVGIAIYLCQHATVPPELPGAFPRCLQSEHTIEELQRRSFRFYCMVQIYKKRLWQ